MDLFKLISFIQGWIITAAECALQLSGGDRIVAGKDKLADDPDEGDVQVRINFQIEKSKDLYVQFSKFFLDS